MIKKILELVFCVVTVLCAAASDLETYSFDEPYKIGMVTNTGGINDGAFKQQKYLQSL